MFPSEVLDSMGAIPSAGAGVTGSDLVPLSPICIVPIAIELSVDNLLVVNSDLDDLTCWHVQRHDGCFVWRPHSISRTFCDETDDASRKAQHRKN